MAKYQHPLDRISVAAPCSANWDDMIGTDRSRFCGQCSLNVYNLSGMTRPEAEDLLNRTEGKLCVRFFRRADGTILTQNCPVGLAAIRVRVKKWVTAGVATVLSFFSGVGLFAAFSTNEREPYGRTMGTLAIDMPKAKEVRETEDNNMIMGEMVAPEVAHPTRVKIKRSRSRRYEKAPNSGF